MSPDEEMRPAMRRNRVIKWGALTVAAGSVLAACGSSGASTGGGNGIINGAGSTFAAPMYQQWAGEYHQANTGTQINYQAIGSGGGVAGFTQGVVDFGATDAPMTATEKSAAQAAQGSTVLS